MGVYSSRMGEWTLNSRSPRESYYSVSPQQLRQNSSRDVRTSPWGMWPDKRMCHTPKWSVCSHSKAALYRVLGSLLLPQPSGTWDTEGTGFIRSRALEKQLLTGVCPPARPLEVPSDGEVQKSTGVISYTLGLLTHLLHMGYIWEVSMGNIASKRKRVLCL